MNMMLSRASRLVWENDGEIHKMFHSVFWCDEYIYVCVYFDAAFSVVITSILIKNLISCWIMPNVEPNYTYPQFHAYLRCSNVISSISIYRRSIVHAIADNNAKFLWTERKSTESNSLERNRTQKRKWNCNSFISSDCLFYSSKWKSCLKRIYEWICAERFSYQPTLYTFKV